MTRTVALACKRLFDFCVAAGALVLLSPMTRFDLASDQVG